MPLFLLPRKWTCLISAPAIAGKRCTVTAVQYGAEAATIEVGNYFELQGAGFRNTRPAKVCVTGQMCRDSDVESDGTFMQIWRLDYPGTYIVNVYQVRGRKSALAYSGKIVIGEE